MADDRRLMRMEEHQATILDMLRTGERMLRSPDRDAAGLSRLRWEVVRAVLAYQGFKHREIFDPAVRGPAPDRAHVARRLRAESEATGDAVRAYVAKWSGANVADRWAEYQPAALAMIADLRRGMTRERREAGALLG